jgi:lysyl-tRNA synthetase class 1
MSIDRDPEDSQGAHWVDTYASKIVREKGDKPVYVCASGITPSGTVHIGNFREIISVELVVRALREMGKKVRFIYSWDDYDAFRKVPKNMPQPEMLARHLRWPITLVPDPFGQEASYARHHEVETGSAFFRNTSTRPGATGQACMPGK